MIEPCRAAVRPRVVSPETGDVVVLEDEVAAWLEGKARTLRIVGGPGSGKTTALRHLAAVFEAQRDDVLFVEGETATESTFADPRRLIYSATAPYPNATNFHRADLQHADFSGTDLSAGNFMRARLNDAILSDADCTGADFRNAKLHRVRLSSAILTDARFNRADLTEADLEGIGWPGASLEKANLTRAYLTGSVMPGAKMHGAILCQAGLADIDWEGADLRDADFSNCAFHLGSSRSGLVGSPIACEGSRTGFYTDDYLEQDFKSPEEIRKANLRGADLRGAEVEKADFYLVDLRGARYSPRQAEHFRRCGAILVDRVRRA